MITCVKCETSIATDKPLDRYPCPTCGNAITAYFTEPDARRISQDEYIAKLTPPIITTSPNIVIVSKEELAEDIRSGRAKPPFGRKF